MRVTENAFDRGFLHAAGVAEEAAPVRTVVTLAQLRAQCAQLEAECAAAHRARVAAQRRARTATVCAWIAAGALVVLALALGWTAWQ